MRDGPNVARVAALIGDHTRAEVLTTLMTGQALTASELAVHAEVTKQTISSHLAMLVDAKLIAVAKQGRHRYFRLADDDVAHLLESLMGVAYRTGAMRVRESQRSGKRAHATTIWRASSACWCSTVRSKSSY